MYNIMCKIWRTHRSTMI